MLTEKQIKEINSHLEKAQNPLFLFDNDGDGLCSFLLLQRALGRGKGIPVKTFPELSSEYFRKISELGADYIFILDKPVISKEFFKEVEQVNIPIVWIDHHEIDFANVPKFVNYYNPLLNKDKKNEPVTYLCYKIARKKEDVWIAVAGCICDNLVPEFYKEFLKQCPDLAIHSEQASEIYYNSQIGRICQMFNFGLKDTTTNVIKMLKFLIKAKSPYEVLEETNENKTFHKRFGEIEKKYKRLVEKAAGEDKDRKLIFFQYGGDLSISADIANALQHRFPKKAIAVARVSGARVSISLRGKGIREIALKAIEGLEGASGGGHEKAVGITVRAEDLKILQDRLESATE